MKNFPNSLLQQRFELFHTQQLLGRFLHVGCVTTMRCLAANGELLQQSFALCGRLTESLPDHTDRSTSTTTATLLSTRCCGHRTTTATQHTYPLPGAQARNERVPAHGHTQFALLQWTVSACTIVVTFNYTTKLTKYTEITFRFYAFIYSACNSCDALASPLQPLPPPGDGWYQPLQTHMPPNAGGANPIYQCSSECSDHSRHSHTHTHAHNHPHNHLHQQQHHGAHMHAHQHHAHATAAAAHAGNGNDTLRSESSQEGGKGNYRCQKQVGGGSSNGGYADINESTEREHMLKGVVGGGNGNTSTLGGSSSCGYEVLGDHRNCSDCCSSSREGDTCSCSEGSCLYAEAGEPAMPLPSSAHLGGGGDNRAVIAAGKLVTQQGN